MNIWMHSMCMLERETWVPDYWWVTALRISTGSFHWKSAGFIRMNTCWWYYRSDGIRGAELLTDTHIYSLPSFLIHCYPVTPRLRFLSPSETSWPLSCTLSLVKSLPGFICQSHFSSSYSLSQRACEPVKKSA